MAVRKARKLMGLDCFSCVLCGHHPHGIAKNSTSKDKDGPPQPAPTPGSSTEAGTKAQITGASRGDNAAQPHQHQHHQHHQQPQANNGPTSSHQQQQPVPNARGQKGKDAGDGHQQQQQQANHVSSQKGLKEDPDPNRVSSKATPDLRNGDDALSSRPRKKAQPSPVTGNATPGRPSSTASMGQHIPQFYFPNGRPAGQPSLLEGRLQTLAKMFSALEGGKAYKQQMADITKACGFPLYWKILLFRSAGGNNDGFITYNNLASLMKKINQSCYDDASRFLRLATKPGAKVMEFDDFEPLIQDVVETHPGLTFLQDAPEFHSRYVTTVASRIMFCVNRTWTGRVTLPELRRSNLLQTVLVLEVEEDINQVKDFFSYEHFYVIYCKFWELDKDHDLYIHKADLARHNDHALNSRVVDRIFSGAVTRGQDFLEGRMSYREFVWFLLAEEDKKHATSVEYWFRCMDLDGDGVVSMYEMEYFHEEQMNKMEALGIERLPFEDTVCQMMDLVCPKKEGRVTLSDLKACKMTNIFFDTFFNLDKFLEHEQRDPFANARDPNAEPVEVSDWNRFAEEEYDILVADEGNGDMEESHYEDDFEPEDEDEILREQMLRLAETPTSPTGVQRPTATASPSSEDIYDFTNTGNLGY